jgi:hypothetical protein
MPAVKSNASEIKKSFDKRVEIVFLFTGLNEKHVCKNTDARAGQWTYVHLAARLPSFW